MQHHLFVCNSFRLQGAPQGVCAKKEAGSLLPYLEEEISDRGLDVAITTTGCLNRCQKGPILMVYPQGWTFGPVIDEDAVDEVLDAIEAGEPETDLLLHFES